MHSSKADYAYQHHLRREAWIRKTFSSLEELGMAVREARKQTSLTQTELAFAAGVGVRFIGELEGGKPMAQIGKIMQVLAALGGTFAVRRNDDRP